MMRPCRILDGCMYPGVRKFNKRTESTSPRLSTLKTSNWPWRRVRPTWNHLARLKSSWLTRSAYSVPGGSNGTASCAAVMFGITRAPGVQGPLQSAAYGVARLINQTVPAPAGALTLGRFVAQGMMYAWLNPLAVKRYPGMLWNEPLIWMPYG